MLTKMFIEKYRGNPVIAMWEVDERGKKVGRYPLVSFGQAKAISLVEHFKEIEAFTTYVAPVQVPHIWTVSEDDIPF